MNNDRLKFRLPFYDNKGKFTHFQYIKIGESLSAYNAGIMYNDSEYQQCMGLKDKKDTLIYENDYLKDKFGTVWIVMWRDAGFVLIDADSVQPDKTIITQELLNTQEFQIIGNSHKNKINK